MAIYRPHRKIDMKHNLWTTKLSPERSLKWPYCVLSIPHPPGIFDGKSGARSSTVSRLASTITHRQPTYAIRQNSLIPEVQHFTESLEENGRSGSFHESTKWVRDVSVHTEIEKCSVACRIYSSISETVVYQVGMNSILGVSPQPEFRVIAWRRRFAINFPTFQFCGNTSISLMRILMALKKRTNDSLGMELLL